MCFFIEMSGIFIIKCHSDLFFLWHFFFFSTDWLGFRHSMWGETQNKNGMALSVVVSTGWAFAVDHPFNWFLDKSQSYQCTPCTYKIFSHRFTHLLLCIAGTWGTEKEFKVQKASSLPCGRAWNCLVKIAQTFAKIPFTCTGEKKRVYQDNSRESWMLINVIFKVTTLPIFSIRCSCSYIV